MHHGLGQLEHVCQTGDGEGVVVGGVGEEVGAKGLLLDLAADHGAHLLGLVEQVPHLKQESMLEIMRRRKRFVHTGVHHHSHQLT